MDDAEEEKVVWPLPGGKHGRRKQKESIAVWNTNHYTWTFWGNLEQGEFPGGGKSISWDISLLNDTLSTSQHASGLEDPHYKVDGSSPINARVTCFAHVFTVIRQEIELASFLTVVHGRACRLRWIWA
jgi:hypothetical protein